MTSAAGHHGTKVTSDAASRQSPIREGAGPVAADSLAAESVREGGGFAQNRDAEPLKVKGANSTLATTDTSAALELAPSVDGASRAGPKPGEVEDLMEARPRGVRDSAPRSSTADTTTTRTSTDVAAGRGAPDGTQQSPEPSSSQHAHHHQHHHQHHHKQHDQNESHQGETAPSYVKADVTDRLPHAKPKGANLIEGGFDSDDTKNASFNSEIGTENDPGRLAELKFQKITTGTALDGGSGSNELGGTSAKADSKFDALKLDEEA
ncbi:MAG: hypothetical protein M1826_004283 [Phylliscum demangeonii]|nr:MAG: hypothetical protein M1826_004283 [Phylliscum demangeonii]